MKRVNIFCLLLFACLAQGQDFRERLMQMRNEGLQANALKVVMEIKVYENSTESIPYYNQKAIIKREQENYFYRISGTDMLMNARYIVMVDESARQIILSERSHKQEHKFVDPLTANIDSILNLYQNPLFVEEADSTVEHYQLALNQASIKTIDLYFNKIKNCLQRVAYAYDTGQLAVIDFIEFNRNPGFAKVDFDETQYIVNDRGRFKTTPKYSRFNLTVN